MSESDAKRRAILVLGMHRSGTSAVTRVVNLLGAQLGTRMLAPAADNERGFWEHEDVVRIDDALLSALGRDWHDPRPLPEGWVSGDAAQSARSTLVESLRQEFAGEKLWAVKDPRMCLLLPLWLDVLRELEVEPYILLVVRDPREVAESLMARDGLPLPQSLWLWFRYMAAAEHASRGLARAIVPYSGLLTDWRDVVGRVASAICIEWPTDVGAAGKSIDSFLDVGQRHHVHSEAIDSDLPSAIENLHAGLLAAASDESAWAAVECIVDEYVDAESLFRFGIDAVCATLDQAAQGDGADVRDLISNLAASVLEGSPVESVTLPQPDDVAKLYWQSGDAPFSEAFVATINQGATRAPTRFKFQLPEGVHVDSVRFDPSTLSGQFEVFGLRVNGRAIDDIESRVLQVHQHRLPSNGPQHVRVLGLDGDPWVRFDLRDCLTEDSGRMEVEITCRCESVRDWMRNIIDVAVVSGMASTVQAVTNATRVSLDAINAGHERQIQALSGHRERMDVQVAKIEQSVEDLSARSTQGGAAILEALADAAGVNLDAIRSGYERLMQAFSTQQERVDAQVAKIERSLGDFSARSAQGDAATLQALTDATSANLDAIRSGHEIQSQRFFEQQERFDAQVAKIERSLSDLSARSAQGDAATLQALNDVMEVLLEMMKENHGETSRMVAESQKHIEAKLASVAHDIAQNALQLAQTETGISARLDRMLEDVAAMIEKQNLPFWRKFRLR